MRPFAASACVVPRSQRRPPFVAIFQGGGTGCASAEPWTNTSFSPLSGAMKPKPRVVVEEFYCAVEAHGIVLSRGFRLNGPCGASATRCLEIRERDVLVVGAMSCRRSKPAPHHRACRCFIWALVACLASSGPNEVRPTWRAAQAGFRFEPSALSSSQFLRRRYALKAE